MTRYIIDIATNRVIFFTQDENVPLNPCTNGILYEDFSEPPAEMSLANCWNWKLFGREIIRQEEERVAKVKPDTLAVNKESTLKLLTTMVNGARSSIRPVLTLGFYTTQIMFEEAVSSQGPWPICESIARAKGITLENAREEMIRTTDSIRETLIRTEQWYQYYKTKINDINDLDALAVLRDEIGARNFKVDLF